MAAQFDRAQFNRKQRAADKALRALAEELRDSFPEVRGDEAAEAALWERVVDSWIAIKLEAGHSEPWEFVADVLVLEGFGKREPPPFDALEASDEESKRWSDVIVARAKFARESAGTSGRSRGSGARAGAVPARGGTATRGRPSASPRGRASRSRR